MIRLTFPLVLIFVLLSCRKQNSSVEKDLSEISLDVTLHETDLINNEISSIINTDNGWVLCSKKNTPYFHLIDTQGNLVKEVSTGFIPDDPTREFLVQDNANQLFRCTLNSQNKKQVLLSSLDNQLNTIKTWLVYEAPRDVSITGFAFDQPNQFIISIVNNNHDQELPSVFRFNTFNNSTDTLIKCINGTALRGYYRSTSGMNSMFLQYLKEGTAANVLTYDDKGNQLSNIGVPSLDIFSANSVLYQPFHNVGLFCSVVCSAESGLSFWNINERGFLRSNPVKWSQSGNMRIEDLVLDRQNSSWVLFREEMGAPTRNLFIAKLHPLDGQLVYCKMLNNTNYNWSGPISLRFNEFGDWSIIGTIKEAQSFKTVILKQK
ncbi:MAG: hypothetical protein GC180_02075 [Bacteroidetes bacterium]|nr:hypothetical protein [Bacteroidota bacterium]